jgi:cobalt-zinc-cadmium efflux system membrane fusion protein
VTSRKLKRPRWATIIQLPGEVRFYEDLTAHIVPRTPGVASLFPQIWGKALRKAKFWQ